MMRKIISVLLACSLILSLTSVISGCSSPEKEGKQEKQEKEEIVTLDAIVELASFSGIQAGWMADVLMKKFHIKLNIIPVSEEVHDKIKNGENLSDIIVWKNGDGLYTDAVKNNLLYDWNKKDLLEKHGSYIKENMLKSLIGNRELTSVITEGDRDTLYGIEGNVAASKKDHDSFFYTWDVRWDLYKKLGYPQINNLEEFGKLLKDMVKICPKNDSGNKTYAVSLWSDWDDTMMMFAGAMASAYYGYDKLGVGLYDSEMGKFHDALEINGPYFEILRFYNKLYREGLLDPESRNQRYDTAVKKVKKGSVLFSVFNYSGSQEYNVAKHINAEKMMYSMKPEEASPLVYGRNVRGDDSIISIGAKTKYPQKCMELINWMCTPEGRLTTQYGPKEVCWKYNDQKKTEFTKVGKQCKEDVTTELGGGYSGRLMDGVFQLLFTSWSIDASNPETDGETYNSLYWESNISEAKSDIENDWRKKTGCKSVAQYMEKGKYTVSPGTSYEEGEKSEDLKATWKRVTDELVSGSWSAIYAKTDAQYNKIVNEMIKKCNKYGYKECVEWSVNEAEKRRNLEDAFTDND